MTTYLYFHTLYCLDPRFKNEESFNLVRNLFWRLPYKHLSRIRPLMLYSDESA
jgi:hypothetical protein